MKKRSESNDFGSVGIKVDQKISFYFNEKEIVRFFENNNVSLEFSDNNKEFTIIDFISNAFKDSPKVKLSKNAENIIDIPISIKK